MFKAATMLILSGVIIPVIAWASVQLFEQATRITKIESDYGHIKEVLYELKVGQKEIRSYIIKEK